MTSEYNNQLLSRLEEQFSVCADTPSLLTDLARVHYEIRHLIDQSGILQRLSSREGDELQKYIQQVILRDIPKDDGDLDLELVVWNGEFPSIQKKLLLRMMNEISNKIREIYNRRDSLTTLLNRETFMNLLNNAVEQYTPKLPLSLLIIDVDNFKGINDSAGHAGGDKVLEAFGQVVRKAELGGIGKFRSLNNTGGDNVRRFSDTSQESETTERNDISAGRLGGEEFGILVEADLFGALLIADRLRHLCKEKLTFTVSIGVTEYHQGGTASALLSEADRAMYYAKKESLNGFVSGGTRQHVFHGAEGMRDRVAVCSTIGDLLTFVAFRDGIPNSHERLLHIIQQLHAL